MGNRERQKEVLPISIFLRKEWIKMDIIKLREDYIRLGQALKAAGLVQTGAEAKTVIQNGEVQVNAEVETRRGRKLVDGDTVEFNGGKIKIEG